MKNFDQDTVKQLQTVAAIVVPGYADLDQSSREQFLEIIDDAMDERPESMRRQLALFLKVLNLAPYLRWGRPLGRLEAVNAERALRWFQEAPVAKLRQGFWGLKTLVFMGYYGRREVWPEVGYAPEFGGSDV
ncbi:MAG: hypothetical protein DRJ65_17725 [Acidobacteria bacterium]|nr:MAG: hypothetical protein DRJ65_17725 [Acidobacteriota bacterium]